MKKYYGASYSTEAHNFGEIQSVFEVPADWQGYRHHGYMWATENDVAGFWPEAGVYETEWFPVSKVEAIDLLNRDFDRTRYGWATWEESLHSSKKSILDRIGGVEALK